VGTLFVATVKPGDVLWLVAVLEKPRADDSGWAAAINTRPIADISHVIKRLRFENGKGITAKPGALGMSLQTPRVLAAADVALLSGEASVITAMSLPTTRETTIPPADGRADRHLQTANERLLCGDLYGALDALLTSWRERRAVEVADLIDALDVRISACQPPVSEHQASTDEAQSDWINLASQKRPEDVGRLLAQLPKIARSRLRWYVQMLENFPPDPRIAIKLVDEVPNESRTFAYRPAFTAIFRMLTQINDARSAQALTERRAAIRCGYLEPRVDKTIKKTTAAPELSVEDTALVASANEQLAVIDAEHERRRPSADELLALRPIDETEAVERQLIAAVLDDPADDAPRLVYMDWLQERGDPRGEFMRLQFKGHEDRLTAKESKRERELLKEHYASWTTPLDAVLVRKRVRFSRGFLSAAETQFSTDEQRALIDHPLWATVEELDSAPDELIRKPRLQRLRRASLSGAALSELAQRKQPSALAAAYGPRFNRNGLWFRTGMSLQSIVTDDDGDIVAEPWDHQSWAPALQVGALQNLRMLSLDTPRFWRQTDPNHGKDNGWRACDDPDFRMFWTSPLLRQLHWLDLWTSSQERHDFSGWLPVIAELPALTRFTYRMVNGNSCGSPERFATFVIEPDGKKPVPMRLQLNATDLSYLTLPRQLERLLSELPNRAIPALRIEYVGSRRDANPQDLGPLAQRLAGAFEKVEIVIASPRGQADAET
jgi:uncharacterized protein (TIGR02996 family)